MFKIVDDVVWVDTVSEALKFVDDESVKVIKFRGTEGQGELFRLVYKVNGGLEGARIIWAAGGALKEPEKDGGGKFIWHDETLDNAWEQVKKSGEEV